MPKNQAAWLMAKHQPLQVADAPLVDPGPGEILVRVRAVAVNPVDWMIPYLGTIAFPWIKPPFVLGSDLAGEVAATGDGVTGVTVGDRVLAMAAGSVKQRSRSSEGAFQDYAIVLPRLTTPIPDSLSYAEAAVVPLGVATAACGLFQKDALALALPSAVATPRNQWVLIWGGSTSVGSNAIQLATAAGYGVVATASPKNFAYVTSLGANAAYDYNSPNLVADIVAVLTGKDVVGALSVGAGSGPACMDILAGCGGRPFVASVSAPISFSKIFKGSRPTLPVTLTMMWAMLRSSVATLAHARRTGVAFKFFNASSVVDNEIGPAIFQDYLPSALAQGRFRAAPPAQVVGGGLRDVQKAFDIQRKGVSASKVVVTLD